MKLRRGRAEKTLVDGEPQESEPAGSGLAGRLWAEEGPEARIVAGASRTGLYVLASGKSWLFSYAVIRCSFRKRHLAACAKPSWAKIIRPKLGRPPWEERDAEASGAESQAMAPERRLRGGGFGPEPSLKTVCAFHSAVA